MLIRGGHRQDYLIVNFGLHFTEDYKGELQTIIEQARSARCRLGVLKRDACVRLSAALHGPGWPPALWELKACWHMFGRRNSPRPGREERCGHTQGARHGRGRLFLPCNPRCTDTARCATAETAVVSRGRRIAVGSARRHARRAWRATSRCCGKTSRCTCREGANPSPDMLVCARRRARCAPRATFP